MRRERKQKKLESADVDSFKEQMYVARIFDQLVFTTDRNLPDLFITPDWRLWMIDHMRAFQLRTDISALNLAKCDRKQLAAMLNAA